SGSASMLRKWPQVLPSSFEMAVESGVRLPKWEMCLGLYGLLFQIRSRSPVLGIRTRSGHDSGERRPMLVALSHDLPPSAENAWYTVPSCVRMTISRRLFFNSSKCDSIEPRIGRSTQVVLSCQVFPPSSLKTTPLSQ